MHKLVAIFVSMLFVSLLIASCTDTRVGDKWLTIPPEGWSKDSVQVLKFDIDDTTNYHTLSIGVRNTDAYRYRNLWLFVNTQTPLGKEHTDTFELMLGSPEGKWYGAGWGNLFSVVAPYREVRFLETGTFTFRIKQGMRHDVLEGIEGVGIRIDKSAK